MKEFLAAHKNLAFHFSLRLIKKYMRILDKPIAICGHETKLEIPQWL